MLRRSILASLAVCLLLSNASYSFAQTGNDLARYQLTGPVKTMETGSIEYKLAAGVSVEWRRVPNQRITFNEKGQIKEVAGYDREDHLIAHKLVYTYDSEGRNTGFEEYNRSFDKTLTVPRRHIYELDELGRRRSYTVFELDGTPGSKFIDVYDSHGNKTEEQFYTHLRQSGGKLVHVFDGRGLEVETLNYEGDDTVSWRNLSKYDERGKRSEWVQYQGGVLRYKILSKYDGKGRVMEEETAEYNARPGMITEHAPEPGKIIIRYDDKKRTKEVTSYLPDGSLKERVVYSSDERGNETERAVFGAEGLAKNTDITFYDQGKIIRVLSGTAQTKYDYDSRGNWTKRTSMILTNGSAQPEAWSAEYRIITYF